MGPLCERALVEVELLAREAVSVSAAGAIEMKPDGKAAFMTWWFRVSERFFVGDGVV